MSIIYHNFWYIDLDNIGEMKPVESIKSSNGEYEVIVSVWYPNRDENNYYIHCDAIKVVALPDKVSSYRIGTVIKFTGKK